MKEVITPQMRVLRSELQASLKKFMDQAEQAGLDYQETALSAVATLAEEQTVLFACIGDPAWRVSCVDELMRRMPEAVRVRHGEMKQAQRAGRVQ